MLLRLDRESRVPLHEQIRAQIALHIDQGTVRPGSKLLPTRVLAHSLGVNRSTVYRGYQELWAQGYLEARPGSYSTVRARLRGTATAGTRGVTSCLDFEQLSAPGPSRVYPEVLRAAELATWAEDPRLINFSTLEADRELCPSDEIQRSFRKTISSCGKAIFDYGSCMGYQPLRESIAVNLRVHGVAVSADEILVTNGSQHGFDLIVRLLARPGTAVAMESPSYSMAIRNCQQASVPIATVPMREDGMDLVALEKILKRRDIAFVYTMPNFQNPTGITTSQAHREELLRLCESHRVPLVEDGFEEELKYFGHAVLPIKSMDSRGVVIYLGTFSKVVFPGLRVGWIAAHANAVARLSAVNRVSSLSGNLLTQAAISHFCQTGAYEEHVRRVHRAYRPRMRALLDGLEQHLPKSGVTWSRPQGGYTLLVQLRRRRKTTEAEAMECLRAAGVLVSPGSLFFPTPPEWFCFRLSLSNVPPAKIAEGCRRLGKALTGLV